MTGEWNPNELLGTRLDSCQIERLLGVGGMGAVYLAQQSRPRRQVAVKVLRPQRAMGADAWQVFLARFRREADAAASLDHANIVPIFEFGEESDTAYLVMPYLADGSLAHLLAQSGQLPLADAVTYIEQAAAALDYAHAHGLVHRDVKPSNLLLHPDGRLLLADFGIARSVDRVWSPFGSATGTQPDESSMLDGGRAAGTPEYMAPEQVRGGPVTPATDVYALGILAYTMLAGQTPFGGGDARTVLARQVTEPPMPLRSLRTDVSARVEETIFWALAKDPAGRPASAGEFAQALREAARGRSLSNLFSRPLARTDSPQRLMRVAGLLAGIQSGVASGKLASLRPPLSGPNRSRPAGGTQALSGDPYFSGSPPGATRAPSGPAAGPQSPSGQPGYSGYPGYFAAPQTPVDAPTVYDAGVMSPPNAPSTAPVWPGWGPAAGVPGGSVRRHFSVFKVVSVAAVAVLGFVLLLGGISNSGLFAQTPPRQAPFASGTPVPTATALPTATATPMVDWLRVSPTSVTLTCNGSKSRPQTVTLQNLGDEPLDWHAELPYNPGVALSPTEGTIPPQGHVNIKIVDRAFWTDYQDQITFQPDTDGAGDPVMLSYQAQHC